MLYQENNIIMKVKKYLILFLFILTTSVYSQQYTNLGWKYTVIVKLKKNYNHACDCQSLFISNKIFDFKLLKSNYKEYWSKSINIVVSCPEKYGENFFKKGNIYRIEFYDDCTDMSSDYGFCGYLSKRKMMKVRFWAHTIELIDKKDLSEVLKKIDKN